MFESREYDLLSFSRAFVTPRISTHAKFFTHQNKNLVFKNRLQRRKNKKMSSNGTSCVLKFAKLSEKAFAPTRGSAHAAGYDLRSAYEYVVPARGKEIVHTDLQVAVPEGTYGRVAPRSGLAWKNFIDVGAGVIDADYRGKLGVILYNHGPEDFVVKPGDRIAQLICERIAYPELQEFDELDSTVRGKKGFGSTGIQ